VQIFLIRHGETDLNARRVVQPPEARLSARGEAQARRLAGRLAGYGVARILTSDHERARATAAAIERETAVPLELDASLQERNFGAIRGTPYEELGIDIFAPDYVPPEGESWAVFRERVAEAWERVTRSVGETTGNLAVVTHGLVCRVLAERHLSLEERVVLPAAWANTSLTIIEASEPWLVARLNCTEHLDSETTGNPLDPSGL
jgi:probable phosphoglycerate mutase